MSQIYVQSTDIFLIGSENDYQGHKQHEKNLGNFDSKCPVYHRTHILRENLLKHP